MTGTPAHPRVTLFVIAFRQEDFVREAVASALAQDWDGPLEILLSDDCSPDGTFRIMEEMAAAYAGPHRVRLNRNPRNLGLIRHLERIMELATGEFVVQNAGDDLSEPGRVRRLVETWEAEGRRCRLVHSRAMVIDTDGTALGLRAVRDGLTGTPTPLEVITRDLTGTGAMFGWSREVFDRFGGLGPHPAVEDFTIVFRAACLGGVRFLDEPLVRKRVGGLSVVGGGGGREQLYGARLKHIRWLAANMRQCLADLDGPLAGVLEPATRTACRAAAAGRLRRAALVEDLAAAGYPGRLALLPRVLAFCLRDRSPWMLKLAMKYLFDRLWIPLADRRAPPAGPAPADHMLIPGTAPEEGARG